MAALLIGLLLLLPLVGAFTVFVAGDGRARAQHALAVAFATAAALAALALLPQTSNDAVVRLPVGGVFGDFTFTPDGLGVFLAAIAAVIGALTVLFSVDYMRSEESLGRFYALMLLFISAMAGLVLTSSLLLLVFFWEIVAFCSYALIAFHNDDARAVAGGVKALIITQFGGAGLLAGVLVISAQSGSFAYGDFMARAASMPGPLPAVAAYGFLLAAAAKSAQVPLHSWLPDAMEAPTPVSALIHAATMVNAGIYLLARFYPAFAAVPGWTFAITLIGLLSILLAALMALASGDLKRVLAYSTISQLGYMVVAVGIGAIFASQFHLLSHAIFKALLFLGAGAVIHATGTRQLRAMGGLGRRMPFTRNAFVVGALALAAIPIVNGFWSKELILEACQQRGSPLALAGLLIGAALTAAYTLRATWLVFAGTSRAHGGPRSIHDAPPAMRLALGTLALGTLGSWLAAGPFSTLLSLALPAAQIEPATTTQMCISVSETPVTALALACIACGLAAWHWRGRLAWAVAHGRRLAVWAEAGFGFEALNQLVVSGTRSLAGAARATQTGQLNWNMLGFVAGILAIAVFLLFGR